MVLVGNELFPIWGPAGEAQASQLRLRWVLRLSPPSVKDLAEVLSNFGATYEASYGTLRTDYLPRKESPSR